MATSFNLVFSEWKTLSLLCLKTLVVILWLQVAVRILFVNVEFSLMVPVISATESTVLEMTCIDLTWDDQSLRILMRN